MSLSIEQRMHKDKFIRTRISMKKDIYLGQVGMTLLLTFAIVYKAGAQEQSRSLTLDLDKAKRKPDNKSSRYRDLQKRLFS